MQRVGGFATPYPAVQAEDHYLPDLDRILDAVDRTFATEPGEIGMNKDFMLPDLGEGLTEADIVSWHVKPVTRSPSTRSSSRSRLPRPWSSCPAPTRAR